MRKKSFLVDTTAASNFGLQFLKKEGAVSQFVLESNKLPRSRLNRLRSLNSGIVLTGLKVQLRPQLVVVVLPIAEFFNKTDCLS